MDSQIVKAIITLINLIILGGLPLAAVYHYRVVNWFEKWSYDWWLQIICTLVYVNATSAEIPALWSRWISYYQLKLTIPDSLYIITTWDRYGHVMHYLVLYLLTWCITHKRIPESVKKTLS